MRRPEQGMGSSSAGAVARFARNSRALSYPMNAWPHCGDGWRAMVTADWPEAVGHRLFLSLSTLYTLPSSSSALSSSRSFSAGGSCNSLFDIRRYFGGRVEHSRNVGLSVRSMIAIRKLANATAGGCSGETSILGPAPIPSAFAACSRIKWKPLPTIFFASMNCVELEYQHGKGKISIK